MKVFYVSWNVPETAFHEMLWKKSLTVYPCLYGSDVIMILQGNLNNSKFE